MGNGAEAEPLLEQSLAARLKIYAENDWRVGSTRSLLGAALTYLHRYSEAESQLLEAKRILKDVPGAQGREARATAARLSALYQSWPRATRAVAVPAPAPRHR
jgi:hypothetical protein